MQLYDRNSIEKIGMSAQVLMERAAVSVVEYILEQFPSKRQHIICVCGNGNNGGDGVAAARILVEYGYKADILLPFDEADYCDSVREQVNIAKAFDIKIYREFPDANYDIIIDAIFGIGLNRDITGDLASLISNLNRKRAYKISLDIPSGIDCNTGEVRGIAFQADSTVTFGFYKRGLYLREGPRHSGSIAKRNMGINEYSFLGRKPEMFMYIYDDEHDHKIDIGRNPQGNKGSFGKVLIIAGREDMSGACVLAAKSALRSGCGMVAVITEECNRAIMIAALPECIVHTYKSKEDLKGIFEEAEAWADVVAIGPGLGTDTIGLELLKLAIFNSMKPLIIDADAINILGRNKRLKIMLLDRQGNAETSRPIIFTPHVREFARLSERSMEDIQNNRVEVTQFFSRQYHCIVAVKDAYTVVGEDDNLYINIISNDAMATAGSGDVLTGLMSSILAQYMRKDELVENPKAVKEEFPFHAAIMSVFIHSRAGLKAVEMNGRSYMIASDVIDKYGDVLV